ncbi:MAG: Flp family type IVb pilin [Candidatus Riflebacteria bacterium]|jgi:pilus assembly protein Flp/PilA|nr:Flp family type IVb pilin [Candidatus Riflebacteria bacterium]
MKLIRRFVKEEEGQALVEYALIIGLISVVAIAALSLISGTVGDMFDSVSGSISSALSN